MNHLLGFYAIFVQFTVLGVLSPPDAKKSVGIGLAEREPQVAVLEVTPDGKNEHKSRFTN